MLDTFIEPARHGPGRLFGGEEPVLVKEGHASIGLLENYFAAIQGKDGFNMSDMHHHRLARGRAIASLDRCDDRFVIGDIGAVLSRPVRQFVNRARIGPFIPAHRWLTISVSTALPVISASLR
ncbi:hypothetical protein BH10PSE7_BH10PSE7_19150 [soil metagenome]